MSETPHISELPLADPSWSQPVIHVSQINSEPLTPITAEAASDEGLSANRYAYAGEVAGQGVPVTVAEVGQPVRSARIFAPRLSAEQPVVANTYDHMFASDEIWAADPADQVTDEPQWHAEKVWPVTEQTRQAAIEVFAKITTDDYHEPLKDTVRQAGPRLGFKQPGDVVDALRTDRQLRLAVGEYFLGRVAQAASVDGYLPDRIVANKFKNPDKGGYEHNLTAQEYVALLCLARLDGTWDQAAVDSSDAVRYDDRWRFSEGTFRTTANIILGIK